MEEIVMRLELLSDRIALALDRFSLHRIDAHQLGDLVLDLPHHRMLRVHVAALAGAIFRIIDR